MHLKSSLYFSRLCISRLFFLSSGCICVCSILFCVYLCWRLLAVSSALCLLLWAKPLLAMYLSLFFFCLSLSPPLSLSLSPLLWICRWKCCRAQGWYVFVCPYVLTVYMCLLRGCFNTFDRQRGSSGVMDREEVSGWQNGLDLKKEQTQHLSTYTHNLLIRIFPAVIIKQIITPQADGWLGRDFFVYSWSLAKYFNTNNTQTHTKVLFSFLMHIYTHSLLYSLPTVPKSIWLILINLSKMSHL